MINYLTTLLAETVSASSSSSAAQPNFFQRWGIWIIFGVFIVVYIVLTFRRNKKQQAEIEKKISSLKPGDKIETIGRIYGTIVEVNDDDNTLIVHTGSDAHGSYIKIDKQAVYRTLSDNAEPYEEPSEQAEPVEEVSAEADSNNTDEQ